MENFATKFIDYIRNTGNQIIVCTHSEAFTKEIANHRQFEPYIMEYRASSTKRKGSFYQLSDNYIMNNLENAYNLIEQGGMDQLQSASPLMRNKILEPLFKHILVTIKDCSSSSLYKATLEYLLNNGVRDFCNKELPSIADEIYNLCDFLNSSDGSHDAKHRTKDQLLQKYNILKQIVNDINKKLKEVKNTKILVSQQ